MKKISVFCLTVLLSHGADAREVSGDYILKLENRLMALEQKLYSSQRPARQIPAGLTGDAATMADFQIRLQTLEEESSKLYGAVEELGQLVREFAKQTGLSNNDVDMRLTDIETVVQEMAEKLASGMIAAPAAQADSAAAEPQQSSEPAVQAEKSPETAEQKMANIAAQPTVPDVSMSEIADMSPDDVYSKAYNFLVATAYDDSKQWLQAFLGKFPNHDLADNAYYWLGEIHLVQGNVEEAVVNFTTGLSQFPNGLKAPAHLLKMGVAFNRLGQTDFARSSWQKLINDFDRTPEAKKAQTMLANLDG